MVAAIHSSQEPWVLFRVNNQVYGIPASNAQEMVTIPDVTPIPRVPEYVRGIINLRGSVIALIDLRLKLGQPSLKSEMDAFIDIMRQREKDHVVWLDTLQHSIDTGEPFTLVRDPHQCAFGKWYETIDMRNARLQSVVARFDAPHRAIHGAADIIEGVVKRGEKDRASEMLKKVRDVHETALHALFDEMEDSLRAINQEVAIVVEYSNTVLAITVDAVESVEPLLANSIEELPGSGGNDKRYIVSMLGRRSSDNAPVLIPDLARIVDEAAQAVREENEAI